MGAEATAAASPRRARIALFDNLKGILIILVVFGHIAHPIHNDNAALSAAFDIIYLFHMPLFVLTSGLFAKGAYRAGRLNVNRITSFAVLGLAFQAALLAVNGVLLTHPERLLRFTSAPWYLIAMAWWYLATPVLAHMKPARGIALTALIALASGCIDLSSGILALGRALAFLPWFALGYYLTPAALERLRARRILWLCVGAAAAIGALRLMDAHAFDGFFTLVYGDNPYPGLGSAPIGTVVAGGIAARLITWVIAGVFSLALLKITPTGDSWLTTLGRRTLPVYVVHRLVRAWLTFHTPFYDPAFMLDPVLGTLAVALVTAGATALGALPAIARPLSGVLKVTWLPASPKHS
ncbi:MAG TPA: acyltransferase family protein [Candidatus Coprousia avicola]|nr:acyltransferase family protein [Candidatus Coprousia avicola]